MFNRSGGPSASEALDGVTEVPISKTMSGPSGEVAELIDQGILSLGDGIQRGSTRSERKPIAEVSASEGLSEEALRLRMEQAHNSESAGMVEIEVRRLPTRGGRKAAPEKYPFGTIGIAREVNGFIEGETFLIPHEDEPSKRIAAGRKRHKLQGKRFLTRTEDKGVRVWRDR